MTTAARVYAVRSCRWLYRNPDYSDYSGYPHSRGIDPRSLVERHMSLFKRIFGHERNAAGKSLDRLVLTVILVAVAVALYSCHG